RLKWFTDSDGMWCLNGRFDPATGARLEGTLRNAVERQFANATPDTCPLDPIEKQQHLAALALAALLLGDDTVSASGTPDVTVLIDAETLLSGHAHEHTIYDIALGRFGLPIETIRRWACIGSVSPVVVAADGVRIMLGRETRIANRHQRRALRALYRSCALCEVPFDHCQIHHVTWYSLGGLTDINQLIPICNKHHHLVHEGGWHLHLTPNRTLTITQPDGAIRTIGPPTIRAA
ncbi:MAG: HNH endonuclease, partial [Actinomycetia bacterium]|nr:HNH endonuclease [Actinomycetes bacterium]